MRSKKPTRKYQRLTQQEEDDILLLFLKSKDNRSIAIAEAMNMNVDVVNRAIDRYLIKKQIAMEEKLQEK